MIDEEKSAKAKLDEIYAVHLSKGTRWKDPEFKPNARSLYINGREDAGGRSRRHRSDITGWVDPVADAAVARRYLEQRGKWCVFSSPSPEDVSQGGLGDCWFLAAMAAVCEKPKLITSLFVTTELNDAGVYCVKLCKDGYWQHVLLDGLFPANGNTLAFAQPNRGQLWVVLIEKAFAKLNGCFEALTGGTGDEALRVMTGQPVTTLKFEQNPNAQVKIDRDILWAQLLSFKDAGFIMCASCGLSYGDADCAGYGLVENHAYTIINVVERQGFKLLQMRNPWASDRRDWKGAWCDHDGKWDRYPRMKEELCPHRDGEGIFWMCYNDFCCFYREAWICKTRDNWFSTSEKGIMPPPKSTTWWGYEITVFKVTELEVSLYQRGLRDRAGGTAFDIGCLLLSLSDGSSDWASRDLRGHKSAARDVADAVGFEDMIRDGRRYVVVPVSFNRAGGTGEPMKYVISFHSNELLVIERKVEIPGETVARGLYLRAKEHGTKHRPFSGVMEYTLSDCGMLSILENRSSSTVEVTVSYSGHNITPSRGEMVTKDVIPPGCFQVVNVISQAVEGAGYSLSRRTSYQTGGRFILGGRSSARHEPPLVAGSVHNAFRI
mmetsp:Transcript_3195/g.9706  ORF Transcript_3195/g.9706 Transcript_3195/m.9706 type:complete len:605 (+) Transcript_3195:568-2382(+)